MLHINILHIIIYMNCYLIYVNDLYYKSFDGEMLINNTNRFITNSNEFILNTDIPDGFIRVIEKNSGNTRYEFMVENNIIINFITIFTLSGNKDSQITLNNIGKLNGSTIYYDRNRVQYIINYKSNEIVDNIQLFNYFGYMCNYFDSNRQQCDNKVDEYNKKFLLLKHIDDKPSLDEKKYICEKVDNINEYEQVELYVKKSPIHGIGLFTSSVIKQGQIYSKTNILMPELDTWLNIFKKPKHNILNYMNDGCWIGDKNMSVYYNKDIINE